MVRAVRMAAPVLALTLLLAGCTLTVRPGYTTAAVYGPSVLVWGHLGVTFGFPGMVVVERHESPHHFNAVFDADASLHTVYADVDRRMRDRGWYRRSYVEGFDYIRAEYVRGGAVATVIVTRQDYPGRYRVVIYD